MTFIEENPDTLSCGVVNMAKMEMLSKVLYEINKFRSQGYQKTVNAKFDLAVECTPTHGEEELYQKSLLLEPRHKQPSTNTRSQSSTKVSGPKGDSEEPVLSAPPPPPKSTSPKTSLDNTESNTHKGSSESKDKGETADTTALSSQEESINKSCSVDSNSAEPTSKLCVSLSLPLKSDAGDDAHSQKTKVRKRVSGRQRSHSAESRVPLKPRSSNVVSRSGSSEFDRQLKANSAKDTKKKSRLSGLFRGRSYSVDTENNLAEDNVPDVKDLKLQRSVSRDSKLNADDLEFRKKLRKYRSRGLPKQTHGSSGRRVPSRSYR